MHILRNILERMLQLIIIVVLVIVGAWMSFWLFNQEPSEVETNSLPDYAVRVKHLSSGTYHITFSLQDKQLSWDDVLNELEFNQKFVDLFTKELKSAEFAAFFWETYPVTVESLSRPFECVLVDSPALASCSADSSPFYAHLKDKTSDIIAFPNLGGDAILVVPRQRRDTEHDAYAHIACFVRQATLTQVREFWKVLAREVRKRLNSRPLWVSTSGMGVSWLHARLDSTPKYYQHVPYKTFQIPL